MEALKTSRFAGNRKFAEEVGQVLWTARCSYQDYHAGKLSRERLTNQRSVLESQLEEFLAKPLSGGWPADAIRLRNRLHRHWDEWFTFLSHPEVKPDNNDAERALRPIVIHRIP